jgi:hypothetical protein
MLITYLAYKNEMPDAAVSALSLDHMVEKDKDAGPLHVRSQPTLAIPLNKKFAVDRGTKRKRREHRGRR